MINASLKEFFEQILENKKSVLNQKYDSLILNFEELKMKLSNVISQPESISDFDFQIFDGIITLDNKLLNNLKFFKKVSNSSFLTLMEEQKQKITESFNWIFKQVEERINEILTSNIEYITLKSDCDNLKQILAKINNNELLTSNDFIVLSKIIETSDITLTSKIEIIKDLALNVCSDYEKNDVLEDEQVVKITNLNKENVINLFNKFKLSFSDFKKDDQEQILQYGNLENISNILSVLVENKIILDIKNYSKKISTILVLSNFNNVSTILENIKEDLGDLKSDELALNEIFRAYLSAPSIFVSGLKKYEIKNEGSKDRGKGENDNSFISGALNNYLLNRKLFLELGIDINAAMKKVSSIFTQSNRKLKTNIHYFETYGIDKSVFINTLSSMAASNPLDLIDQFIEAGPDCYDYIINCFSQTKLGINSPELYQLINAKKSGWTDEEIYRYIKSGTKTQKQRRATNLEKLSGDSLVGEPQYNVPIDNIFLNIDFSNQESIDDKVINNYYIKQLEEKFKHDDLTYNFNGIIISRYKVLRNYAILLHNQLGGYKSLEYAIFKNKILTKTEYDMVKTTLNKVFDKMNNILGTKKNVSQTYNQSTLNTTVETTKKSNTYLDDSNNVPHYLKNILIDNQGEDLFLVKSAKITDTLNNMFFIQYLDSNFKDNEFEYNYNFSGVKVSRYWTKLYLADLISKGEVAKNPKEAIIRAIILASRARNPKYALTKEQITIVESSLSSLSNIIDSMGRKK